MSQPQDDGGHENAQGGGGGGEEDSHSANRRRREEEIELREKELSRREQELQDWEERVRKRDDEFGIKLEEQLQLRDQEHEAKVKTLMDRNAELEQLQRSEEVLQKNIDEREEIVTQRMDELLKEEEEGNLNDSKLTKREQQVWSYRFYVISINVV